MESKKNFEIDEYKFSISAYRDAIVSFILSLSILFLRKPGAIFNPRLCNEDGPIFYGQAATFGWHSLTTVYASYYHTLPRLVALLLQPIVPLSGMPLAFTIAAALITAASSAAITLSRLDLKYKWLFAILPLIMPHGGEVFLFLYDVQWMIAPYLIVICLENVDDSDRISIFRPVVALVIGLTGPFSIFLCPFFFLRCVVYRKYRNEILLFLAVALAAIIQAYSVVTHPIITAGPFAGWSLVPGWLFWGVLGSFFGYDNAVHRLPILILFVAFAAVILLGFMRTPAGWRIRIYAMAGIAACIMAAALARVGGNQITLVNPFTPGAERYFYIPYAMAGWSMFILAVKAPGYWRGAPALALFVSLAINSSRFAAPPVTDPECYTSTIPTSGPSQLELWRFVQ